MATNDHDPTNPSSENQETIAFKMPRELPEGTLLNDRYALIRQLSRGGFGTVYLAHDRQMHDRPVVVKVQSDQRIDDPWFERKFSEEVRALSMIDHPGVVVAIDSGRTPDGKPFLVMQYVDGATLRTVMKPEGMPLDRAAEILKQVGHALGAAHDRGILHRDLKPENLMLQTSAEAGERVRLIDFGIASVADIENKYQTTTRLAGTIVYMAPEQLAGQPSALTDIYAMGLIAHEMVTGRRPFVAENAVQLAGLQRAGVRIKPSDLRPGLPAAAERLILKSLEYEPSRRPTNARAFGDDLHDALLNIGVTRIQQRPEARRGFPRNTIVVGCLLGTTVLAGVAYFELGNHPEPRKAAPPKTTLFLKAPSDKALGDDEAVEVAFWDSVKDSSEPQLYREYLNKYPEGRFASLANVKLAILARRAAKKANDSEKEADVDPGDEKQERQLWKETEKSRDAELYRDYLEAYPHGRYAELARKKLNSSRETPTIPDFPGAQDVPNVVIPDLKGVPGMNPTLSAELSDWNALKNAKDAKPYQSYLAKYPNGMFATIARMKIANFDRTAGK